jgi:hypothetical protein
MLAVSGMRVYSSSGSSDYILRRRGESRHSSKIVSRVN